MAETERGKFVVSAEPSGLHYAVLVMERRGDMRIYVDLLGDPRFDWFGWRHKVATFETALTADHLVEYNDRASTLFHKIGQPMQKMSSSSVKRLLDLCERLSKATQKKR